MSTRRIVGIALLAGAFVFSNASSSSAQVSDVTPPILNSLSISTTSVDTTLSDQQVVFTLGVVDDLSGALPTEVNLTFQGRRFRGSAVTTVPGTQVASITIPRHAVPGTWLVSLRVQDAVGNSATLSTAFLQAQPFPAEVVITCADPDTQTPVLTSVSVTPDVVDVSAADAQIVVRMTLQDDKSGVLMDPLFFDTFAMVILSPGPVFQQLRLDNQRFSLVEGTRQSGTWQATVVVPRYSDSAVWNVSSVRIDDRAGNVRSYSLTALQALGTVGQLTVSSDPTDRTPPTVAGLSFSRSFLDTSASSQAVDVSVRLTDDLSGSSFDVTTFFNKLWFTSPSGQQMVALNRSQFQPVEGSLLDRTWRARAVFPRFAELGPWRVTFFRMDDRTHNVRLMSEAALRSAGFPTEINVLTASLAPDAVISTEGGIAADAAFGMRASLTIPPNVLPGPTTIAIDVLQNAFSLPVPTSFDTTAGPYVNIVLTPQPDFPLPAPGITLTLPLTTPLIPGLQLSLYKIDPFIGSLVEALGLDGLPITGIVAADGLSATFSGVASFSTVVALLPSVRPLAIDVKPGDRSDAPVNSRSRGVLPIAVLATSDLDPVRVDLSTLTVTDVPVTAPFEWRDANGDGRTDLIIHAPIDQLALPSPQATVTVRLRTIDGLRFAGEELVRVLK